MKKAKFERKMTLKSAKARRVAGVQVRSGVKAGRINPEFGGPGGIGDSRLL